MYKSIIAFLLLALFSRISFAASAPWVGTSLQGVACNGGGQGYGPYDYLQRNVYKQELEIVEPHHFPAEVENLIKGHASGDNPEGDINYTLRAWPNHHRALLTIIKFQLNINNNISRWKKLDVPPECYLQRAIHFSPEDGVSYSLYAYYLKSIGRMDDAKKYYQKALELDPENAKFAYSYSLFLIDTHEYDEALKYAKLAYQNRKAPKGLRNKLEKLGVWKEEN
jgi:tetratricopeptide (TPR) repeat protein